jgi:hemolysin III
MEFLHLREPVSAWSHGVGLLLAVPITLVLIRRSGDDAGKSLSLLVFGLSLAACYGASTLYHAVRVDDQHLMPFRLLDHVAIFALIAGTYTPIAWNLLEGSWRHGSVLVAWLAAGAGAILHLACGSLSPWISTGLYVGMGWGALFAYAELGRTWPHRRRRWIPAGGVLYTVGAAVNLAEWPMLWPGTLAAHELFHLFVLAGTGCHVWFILAEVVPGHAKPVREASWRSWPLPHALGHHSRLVPVFVRTRESSSVRQRLGARLGRERQQHQSHEE